MFNILYNSYQSSEPAPSRVGEDVFLTCDSASRTNCYLNLIFVTQTKTYRETVKTVQVYTLSSYQRPYGLGSLLLLLLPRDTVF